MPRLVQSLPPGPLVLVGDVHGEVDALRRLLQRLGCDLAQGSVRRHLVFLGDLVDRGPDSPGVVALVRRFVEAGVASCVAGNHEFNLVQADRKEGNGWFFGHDDAFPLALAGGRERRAFPSVRVRDAAERDDIAALVREDLRVVHACWDAAALEALPDEGCIGPLGERLTRELRADLERSGTYADARAERQLFADLQDPDVVPDRPLPAMQALSLAELAGNPIKVLTSGREEPIPFERTFFIGGKWRVVQRSRWWETYQDAPAVVVGHYWRRRALEDAGSHDLWDDVAPVGWAGPRGNVFCLDYSVGRRFLERWRGRTTFAGGLAAMRWPERTLVFDDRDEPVPTTGFSRQAVSSR